MNYLDDDELDDAAFLAVDLDQAQEAFSQQATQSQSGSQQQSQPATRPRVTGTAPAAYSQQAAQSQSGSQQRSQPAATPGASGTAPAGGAGAASASASPCGGEQQQSLSASLLPFQREGVRQALAWGGRLLLGDEMGLGKTIQSIAIAQHYRAEWPLLVLCPTSLSGNWAEELERWCPALLPGQVA